MKLVISQETFDAAVRDNIDEFDMSLKEAVEEAQVQFRAAGVEDFSGLLLCGGSEGVEREARKVRAVLDAKDGEELDTALHEMDGGVVGARGGVEAVAARLEAWARGVQEVPGNRWVREALAAVGRMLEPLEANRMVWFGAGGIEGLVGVARRAGFDASCQDQENEDGEGLVSAWLVAARVAMTKMEKSKARFAEVGGLDILIGILSRATATSDSRLLNEGVSVVRTLLSFDDPTVSVSEIFDRARVLAGEPCAKESGLKTLETSENLVGIILSSYPNMRSAPGPMADIFSLARYVAVNDSICASLVDGGLVQEASAALQGFGDNERLVRATLVLLRSLSARDDCKGQIANGPALGLILECMTNFQGVPQIQEAACGTIASVCLRSPANAQTVVDYGGVDSVIGALDFHITNSNVVIAACHALRNLVSRNAEIREAIQKDGRAENLLRCAILKCRDPARAALKDLGVLRDDELSRWTPGSKDKQ